MSVEHLTGREIQVLEMLAKGFPDRVIAEKLTIAPGTVRAHKDHIFQKLGIQNRVQAALFYHGLQDGGVRDDGGTSEAKDVTT